MLTRGPRCFQRQPVWIAQSNAGLNKSGCSTIEEALFADELGFDFIGTTMVGYTPQSKGLKIEGNDFEILRTILKKVKHPVIAEGNVNSPEKAKRVIELGSYAVVVGSSITRPQLITKGYAEAVNSVEKETTV